MAIEPITGAEIIVKALIDQGVDVIFGYPGGAVLPLYDALFKQNRIKHILVRHGDCRGQAARRARWRTGHAGPRAVAGLCPTNKGEVAYERRMGKRRRPVR